MSQKGTECRRFTLVDSDEESKKDATHASCAVDATSVSTNPNNASSTGSSVPPVANKRPRSLEGLSPRINLAIKPVHLKQIINAVPLTSEIFRCISKREGCHLLRSNLPRSHSGDVSSLEYPPEILMECGQYFCSLLSQDGYTTMTSPRIGMIQYVSVSASSRSKLISVGPITAPNDESGSVIVILVLGGQLIDCMGKGPVVSGGWHYSDPDVGELCLSSNAEFSLLVYHFFRAANFKHLSLGIREDTITCIKDGFQLSGMELRVDHGDKMLDHVLKPFYHQEFNPNTECMEVSLLQSISLFIQRHHNYKRTFEPATFLIESKGQVKKLLTQVESKVKEILSSHDKSIDFSLLVIANLPSGMTVIHGGTYRTPIPNQKQPCVLYFHNGFHPTIATFNENENRHFILMEEEKGGRVRSEGTPYTKVSYPEYLDPHKIRTTPCDYRKARPIYRTAFTCFAEHAGDSSLPNLLKMTEQERKVITQLNFQENFALLPGKDDVRLDPKQCLAIRGESSYISDEVMELLLLG